MNDAYEMKIKFYGTRGSLPAPLTASDVEKKVVEVAKILCDLKVKKEDIQDFVRQLAFPLRGTYGGNTTCCVVRCGETIIVLDMGSGLRQFGQEILSEMFTNSGKIIHFCMSHVHWDHIQGFPFFAPLFISRKKLPNNRFIFFGGVTWQGALEEALRGQMDAPVFPVEWNKVTTEGPGMKFLPIHDGYETMISHGEKGKISPNAVKLQTQRLHHPNETYGWRIEYHGKSFVFASDTEPFAGGPDPMILDLAKNANLLYMDCQFSEEQYLGKAGPPRLGWGHGYDKWCAEVAKVACVENLIFGHHDPAASDEVIIGMEQCIQKNFENTRAAYDGMEITI